MLTNPYELNDRYLADDRTVFMSGIQALARVPIEQLRRDRLVGKRTASFIAGYPGSPLGGFDQEVARALAVVDDLPIVHRPGVNEELSATAVMGSQLASVRSDATYDGVVGIWYGKAPGLDRGSDAIRHGNFAGADPHGGVLALVGDDPGAKSSTMPNSSDAALVDLQMPVLYPGTIAECIELGLHGIAMSRASGLWSAMKIVTPIADGTGTVDLASIARDIVVPELDRDGATWSHTPSATFLGPRMVAAERELRGIRTEMTRRYGQINDLNRQSVRCEDAWLGIVSTGYTHAQLLEALRRLGLTNAAEIRDAGIRILNLRMPIPFDTEAVRLLADGVDEVVVVEEKNPTLERLVRDALYTQAKRPSVVGKHDEGGAPLFPEHGHLDADAMIEPLRRRLSGRLVSRLAPEPPQQRTLIPLSVSRTPYFCSGCPHNASTEVPEGSVVGVGTGCHAMTFFMDDARVGDDIGITAMGNEGSQWIGMEPFVDTGHVFQNLGDGTYFHSGQIAVQAAIGSGSNITYKILYNHTVAMTGGQDTTHRLSPAELAESLLLQGVAKVTITTDDTSAYRKTPLPLSVDVLDRSKLLEAQAELAAIPGVTVLIHDQGCAAELRRDRKRGRIAAPIQRVVINHRICEGCGDCGETSNCLSVQPVDTPLGRKTTIDQASCNLDFSCLDGDCPAFMTVDIDPDEQRSPSKHVADAGFGELPEPVLSQAPIGIRMTGIGGTGVVTAAQILATAAMLGGLEADGLDQTGLSQKAGPVISDLVLSPPGGPRQSNLIGEQQADLVLAFDELVALSDGALAGARSDHTKLVASTSETPTGAQVVSPELTLPSREDRRARMADRTDPDASVFLDAQKLAEALTQTAATSNTLLLGVASQQGFLPVGTEHIIRAIELNGVAVDANLAAFEWGRRWVLDSERVEATVAGYGTDVFAVTTEPLPGKLEARVIALGLETSLEHVIGTLASDLVAYQDQRYAAGFLSLVERTHLIGNVDLTETLARSYHKLLAYKDEYEVARLMIRDDGLAEARQVAPSSPITWHLHPPMLKALGVDGKIRFSQRTRPAFAALAKGKRLRGTAADPFGRAELRRLERELPVEYDATIRRLLDSTSVEELQEHDIGELIRIAGLPDGVRGFEDLKMRRATTYRQHLDEAANAFLTRSADTRSQ